MAEGNGKNSLDRVDQILAALLEHARVTDEHQDRQDRNIEELRQSIVMTNDVVRNLSTQTGSMLGALRELIGRIPPENLR